MASPGISRIGRFEIKGQLGKGGFGTVYRAWDPYLERQVALKVLSTEGDHELLSRFLNEAKAAGRLDHTNIITVYESGEYNGMPYMVMELLEGQTLKEIIKEGKYNVLNKLRVMLQVARGLNFAHQKGVVHRDIKPANIMVKPDGSVKILDFGIARLVQSQSTRLTHKGDLIGTFWYMAPEQFETAEADARSDIFAYGVVCYELLTGEHPFDAENAALIINRIRTQEPRPICSRLPECPPSLQHIVERAISKDRDLRYQSLDELQLDAGPILDEMEKERAAGSLLDARGLFESGNLDTAQAVLREVLDLDPGNRDAHRLREAIQQQLNRRAVWPRVEALFRKAEEEIVGREFAAAVESLEAAARLDRTDQQIQSRLHQARGLLERSKRVGNLLAKTYGHIRQQDFTGAYQKVSEALDLDPDDPESNTLLQQIQKEVERLESERVLQEKLSKARGLLLLQQFDSAIVILTDLAAQYPGSTRVDELLVRARSQKLQQEQQLRLQAGIASAKDLLNRSKFAEAAERLQTLQSEFPNEPDLTPLLAYAREQLNAEERARTLDTINTRVQELCEADNFDPAIEVINQGLKTYPDDTSLMRALKSTMAAKAAHERELAISRGRERVEELRQAQKFLEALQLADACLRDLGEATFADLKFQLEEEWKSRQRDEAIAKAITNAQEMIDQGRATSAVLLLTQTRRQFPDESRLGELLTRAQDVLQAQQRAEALEKVKNEARMLREGGEFDRAIEILERGLGSYPGEHELLDLLDSTRTAKEARNRQQAVRTALRRCADLQRRGRFKEALDVIEKQIGEHGDDSSLVNLRQQLREEWEQRERAEAVKEVAESARVQIQRPDADPDATIQLLKQADTAYPGEPVLKTLLAQALNAKREQEKRSFIAQQISAASHFEQSQQWWPALNVLREAIDRYPESTELGQAYQRIQARLEEAERHKRIHSQIGLIEQAIANRDWTKALQLNQTAQAEFAGAAEFGRLFELIRQGQREQQQQKEREFIHEQLSVVVGMEQRQEWDAALKVLGGALHRYPDSVELTDALHKLQNRQRESERDQKIKQQTEMIEKFLSQADWSKAVQLIQVAQREFEGEETFDRLLKRAAEVQRCSETEEIIRSAQERKARGDLDGAIQVAARGMHSYPEESRLENLKLELEQERSRLDVLQRARIFLSKKRFDEAESVVRELLIEEPKDQQAQALLESVVSQREEQRKRDEEQRRREQEQRKREEDQRKRICVTGRRDAQRLVEKQSFDEALVLLNSLVTQFPDEVDLQQEIHRVTSARDEYQARQAHETRVLKLSQLQKEGRAQKLRDDATAILSETDDSRVRQMLTWAEQTLTHNNESATVDSGVGETSGPSVEESDSTSGAQEMPGGGAQPEVESGVPRRSIWKPRSKWLPSRATAGAVLAMALFGVLIWRAVVGTTTSEIKMEVKTQPRTAVTEVPKHEPAEAGPATSVGIPQPAKPFPPSPQKEIAKSQPEQRMPKPAPSPRTPGIFNTLWSGTVGPGQDIMIEAGKPPAIGEMGPGAELSGEPIQVKADPPLVILETPGPKNRWKRLRVRNSSQESASCRVKYRTLQ